MLETSRFPARVRTPRLLVFALWWAAVAVAPSDVRAELPAPYRVLADELARTHPSRRALRSAADIQRARVDRAGSLPDPMVMLEWSMIPLKYPFSLSRTEMSGVELSLQQEIPYPGKLRFAEEAERRGLAVLDARNDDVARTLRGAVAQMYYELAFSSEAIGILDRNERLLRSLAEHARIQIAAGRSTAADVLRARTELAQLKERRFSFAARRLGAESRLNALLGRPRGSPLAAPALLGAPPVLAPFDELLRRADRAHPSLRMLDAERSRALAEQKRADRGRYPNFILGASYRFRSGPADDMVQGSDFYSLRFGLTLPIWGRQRAEAREAHARASVAADEIDVERRRIEGEIHRLHAEWAKEQNTLKLYRDEVRPLAEAAMRALIPVYVAGRGDFHALLQAWTRVLEADLEALRALATLHAKTAELETAVGASILPGGAR